MVSNDQANKRRMFAFGKRLEDEWEFMHDPPPWLIEGDNTTAASMQHNRIAGLSFWGYTPWPSLSLAIDQITKRQSTNHANGPFRLRRASLKSVEMYVPIAIR